jgi:uncharacterized protein YjbI with pentapeptide repeats
MANEEHLKILKQGVEAWNKWREVNLDIVPDLSRADLNGTKLPKVNLSGADLSGAMISEVDLCEANLHETTFFQATLSGADLSKANLHEATLFAATLNGAILLGANLYGANLRAAMLRAADLRETRLEEADLSEANLGRAILVGANLGRAILDGADLSKARIGFTTFGNVDLSTVKGLEAILHMGPSSVGIDTIYHSKGKIPVEFLRGAGVPDNFIDYMSSLVGTAFEFYSCFISYSSKDQEFADRLFADLQHEGVRCWFAPHHAQAGKKLHEQIDVAIRLHEKLLLILSPDSINSEWVKTEIAKARKREGQEKKRVLFPVRLNISYEQLQEWECFDVDRGKDSAREIREYYIPDFTKWKDHDQYQEEFKKLVRDLKK